VSHKCPVKSCTQLVGHGRLMCPSHWHLVPRSIADRVYAQFRKAPRSEAHFAVMQEAVEAVNKLLEAA
jgi:hypothetical protein